MNTTENHTPSVLIVDDDPNICDFIAVFATHQNFKTTSLSDASDFGSVYNINYDLIILDLNMPGVDGIELIRFLSNNKSDAQIILISAAEKNILRAAQDLATSQNLNVTGVLNKPIDPDALTQLLSSAHGSIVLKATSTENLSALPIRGTRELPSIDELRQAIKDDQIDVFFQPKIGLSDLFFAGAEGLARWYHPEKGNIPPDYFITIAEKYGLIDELTNNVMSKACRYIQGWGKIPEPYQVSINISELNLSDLNFPDMITKIVTDHKMAPSSFMLEVTESTISTNPTVALDVLTRLRLRGFALSIDDFGTGHSSLARLRQIPFGELKIDKSFVVESDTSAECRAIVKNTLELAGSLGLQVVAEGAESKEHVDILMEYGCDKVQGYYFSRPLPNSDFVSWVHGWISDPKKNQLLVSR